MIQKARVSAAEIRQALNEALHRRQQCAALQVARIFETNCGPANWDADISGPQGSSIDPECKRVMLATKLGLQNRFDLTTD